MDVTTLTAKLKDYFSHHKEITVAILFGSFAKGTADSTSDVDVAIHADSSLSMEQFAEMQLSLSTVCGRDVDLADLRHAEGTFLYQIMTTGRRITYDENTYVYYAMKALDFHETYLPILRACQQERIRRFVHGQ